MAKTKTTAFEAADHLDNEEVRLEYLKEAFETRDTEYIRPRDRCGRKIARQGTIRAAKVELITRQDEKRRITLR